MTIGHFKSVTVADGTNADIVRPSDWNSIHSLAYTITGNTAGVSTVSGTNIVLAGGSNVTVSASQAAGQATLSFIAPTQSAFVLSNSNGVSFGTNGSTVTATVKTDYLTTAMASNRASDFVQATAAFAGTNASGTIASNAISVSVARPAFSADASSTYQTLTFQDSNGVSFSNNAGALRVTHGLQFTSATSAITSAALHTSASRVINIVAATNNTGGGTASLSSNVSFSAANGLTFYTSAGGAIVGSHNAITTARASNDAIGLNTAQSNVTWTVNSSGLSLDARGYAGTGTTFNGANISGSMTVNSGGVQLSLSGAGGGTTNQTGPNIAAGTQTATSGTVVFSNSNNITFGMSDSSVVTASFNPINIGASNLGNTAGTTGTIDGAGAQFVFVGVNDISLSQSVNGASATLSIVGEPMMSRFFPGADNLTYISAPTNASASLRGVEIPHDITGTRMDILVYQSLSSSAVGNTYGQQWSIYMGIYSNDTANNRLFSLSSGSTQTTWTVASNTAGATQINGSGVRPISCPVNFSMTPGQYFVAVNWVTSTFSSGTATTALNRTVSIVGRPTQSASFAAVGEYNVATGASVGGLLYPQGVFSAASTGLPASISYSQFTHTGASRLLANIAVIFRNN